MHILTGGQGLFPEALSVISLIKAIPHKFYAVLPKKYLCGERKNDLCTDIFLCFQQIPIDIVIVGSEYVKYHFYAVGPEKFPHSSDGNLCGFLLWKAEHSR